IVEEENLLLLDIQEQLLPCKINNELRLWQLLAMSGGHPIAVFGIWEKNEFLPLAAQIESRWVDLSIRYERKTSSRSWYTRS
ncbi:MAG: hypothetical protein AAFO82_20665, partial [Bacteroidota bacterium]